MYKTDLEEKKNGLYQRMYFMDGILAKNSTTNISVIVAFVDSVNMRHICVWQNKKNTFGFFEYVPRTAQK